MKLKTLHTLLVLLLYSYNAYSQRDKISDENDIAVISTQRILDKKDSIKLNNDKLNWTIVGFTDSVDVINKKIDSLYVIKRLADSLDKEGTAQIIIQNATLPSSIVKNNNANEFEIYNANLKQSGNLATELHTYTKVESQLFQLPYDSATILQALLKSRIVLDSSQIIQIRNKEIQEIVAFKALLDSSDLTTLEEKLPDLAKKFFQQREELQYLNQFEQIESQININTEEQLQWDSAKIADKLKIQKLLNQDVEILNDAKQKIAALKNKYTEYNSADSSFTLKKKDKPKKRWQVAFNLETAFRPYVSAVIAPGIIYNINKKLNIGLATSFDYKYFYKDTTYHRFSQNPTIRAIFQYDVYRNIFIQAEYEQPYQLQFASLENNLLEDERSPIFWLGVGLENKLYKKLKLQTQLLYNLSSIKKTVIDQKRWAVRINLIY